MNPTARLAPRATGALALLAALVPSLPGAGQEPPRTIEDVARDSRDAVVVISSTGRRGEERGLGSGFVIGSDGVIATNYHVIGQRRPFHVRLADGQVFTPTAILALDRVQDLALLRIDAKELPSLALGDSDALQPGQTVVAVGNPLGLELSVTRGAIAATREIEGRPLLQVAMPIEPGSSGSPLLDLHGRVIGVMAIKSGSSLGFAVPVNQLERLLSRQHPVAMARWLTIGALDPTAWQPLMGGDWRQRAGRLIASGEGDGFGGRMLCLSRREPPRGELEIEVEVRLDDESGAAGLAFHADGGDRHYGFYPTGGSLRLTRFEGPDVFSWTILRTVRSDAYRPGEWNRLRVSIAGSRLQCYVNGDNCIELDDAGLASGRVGLVKFRQPAAHFRRFRVAGELSSLTVPDRIASRVSDLAARMVTGDVAPEEALDRLADAGDQGLEVLADRAASLEKEAARLRVLADRVHRRSVERRLLRLLDSPEEDIDLLRAALHVARLDNREIDVDAYVRMVDRLASDLRRRLPDGASAERRLAALRDHVFDDLAFHGSHAEYYHRSNSYINEVLDDREGIPITLTLVFTEFARRLDLPVVGVGIPRHFMAMHVRPDGTKQLIDVFNRGKLVSRQEASTLSGELLDERDLVPATKRSILVRMLRNLLNVAQREDDADGMLRYLDVLLALDENSAAERWLRGMLLLERGEHERAAQDLDWLLEHRPAGIDLRALRNLRESLRRRAAGS